MNAVAGDVATKRNLSCLPTDHDFAEQKMATRREDAEFQDPDRLWSREEVEAIKSPAEFLFSLWLQQP